MAETKKEQEKPLERAKKAVSDRAGKSERSEKPTWRKSTHGQCPYPKAYNVVD